MVDEKCIESLINDNKKYLDDVQEHTHKKVEYVKNYVYNWLFVVCNRKGAKTINFIDCMCNAGIYLDGKFGTPIEVLQLFNEFSQNHTDLTFNLFFNDYEEKRIEILQQIIASLNINQKNIKIYYDHDDVNSYLINKKYNSFFNSSNAMTILFVDPYNFGDVKINNILNFIHNYYCELLFNYFSSDYNRNIENNSAKLKKQEIIESMAGIKEYDPKMSPIEVLKLLQKVFKEKNIKYSFGYEFRIGRGKGIGLYHILYATPKLAGLEKLKIALWKTFDGSQHYKSDHVDPNQGTLFNNAQNEEMNVRNYATEACNLIIEQFKGQTVTYNEISEYILENTMLKGSQIKKQLLIPLLEINKTKRILPDGVRANNYEDALYRF